MKIAKLKAVTFPSLTLFFLLLAWITGGKDLQVALRGKKAAGTVAALLRCDETRCDLILDITQNLILQEAGGGEIAAATDRDGAQELRHRLAGTTNRYTAADIAATRKDNGDPELAALLASVDAVRESRADSIQRFLQREQTKPTDARIVAVERTERTRLLSGLAGPITGIETDQGRVTVVTAGERRTAEDADEIVTRIRFTFIGGTDEASELKTDVRREMTRTWNGEPFQNGRDDFILYSTDYRSVYRAVFIYETAQGTAAAVADLGARVSPRSGHFPGDEVLAAWLPEHPEQVTLLSDFSILKGQGPLEGLNTLIELTFGRWFFPAVSLLVALVYLVMSVITVSLVLKPPKTENADTVDEEALAGMK